MKRTFLLATFAAFIGIAPAHSELDPAEKQDIRDIAKTAWMCGMSRVLERMADSLHQSPNPMPPICIDMGHTIGTLPADAK